LISDVTIDPFRFEFLFIVPQSLVRKKAVQMGFVE